MLGHGQDISSTNGGDIKALKNFPTQVIKESTGGSSVKLKKSFLQKAWE